MRAFSGIVDLPALLMVLGSVFVIILANGFSRRGSLVMAHGLLMEVALLFLLISLIPLFEDPINFMALPYMASFALVTFALAGLVTIMLSVFLPVTQTLPSSDKPKPVFRVAAIAATLLGVGYLAIGNTTLGAYAGPNAVVFTLAMLTLVGTGAWRSAKGAALAVLANQLPNIAILGLVIAISAAVLDIYELPALLPLLGFGLTVAFSDHSASRDFAARRLGEGRPRQRPTRRNGLAYQRLRRTCACRAVAGLKRADKMRPQGDEVSAQSPRPYTARSKAVKAATDSLSIKGST